MGLQRTEAGEVDIRVSVYRDGERLEANGSYDISDYVLGIEITETITLATLECQLSIMDSGGVLGAMTGSEKFRIQVQSTIIDRTYWFRAYEIQSRTKTNEYTETYIINAISDEYLRNEVKNVFGNSEVLFEGKTKSHEVVEQLIKDKKYIGSSKRSFIEETLNKQNFIATNWRPLDTIYWISQRSIRKMNKGGDFQNGFLFFESALGFNFSSIDHLIDDINDQTESKSNYTTGKVKLYTYEYSPKKLEGAGRDQYRIEGMSFPKERNYLLGLRDGDWSGYSVGFDPVTISNSKMGLSTDMQNDAYRYSISNAWRKMSHLGTKKATSVYGQMDKDVQSMVDYPKRTRYTVMPNQIFDPKFKDNPQKNYQELVELQAYQYMRIESLKAIQMLVKIPGNLDLYAGKGINLIVPSVEKVGTRPITDKRYSGKYLIAGITHSFANRNHKSELILMKDAAVA
tara:strand:- start:813 stop:2183 length:1371 start_codon:yes stop_codon:yes gene_type:complete